MTTIDSIFTSLTPQDEIWKPITGYEGIYEVSNCGRIKRVKAGKRTRVGYILKGAPNPDGYLIVTLYKNKTPKRFKVHKLVMALFNPPMPSPKHEINHINTNRADNHAENLEWLTHAENIKHSVSLGKYRRKSETSSGAKLNWAKVREIRELVKSGHKRIVMAEKYGVCLGAIDAIMQNRTWKENIYPQ